MIENKGGAGGYIAWQMVAASPNDGYTVLVAENALGINQALFKKHPSGFNPLKDYDAVGAMANTPLVWTVANNVPANTFKEFVAWSKTVPEKFNYGHAGPGSVSHLVPEVILDGAGMQAQPVPFKGGGPAAQAVAGGHVAVVASSLPVAKAQIEGKLVKSLFVTSAKRSPAMPDVPALPELGFKFADVDLEFWWGLFVPKGMPEPIRAKLEKALQATMANPAVRERLAQGRHRSVVRARPGAQGQARERDHQLVEVHRRQGHQGRAITLAFATSAALIARDLRGDAIRASMPLETLNSPSTAGPSRVEADGSAPLLSVLRDELGLRGTQVRLRHRAMRRLHGADRRQAGLFLHARGGTRRRQDRHHRRGAAPQRRAAPAAAGVPRRAGRPVRLLPARHPGFGRGAAREKSPSRAAPTSSRRSIRICAAAASTTASSARCRGPAPSLQESAERGR